MNLRYKNRIETFKDIEPERILQFQILHPRENMSTANTIETEQ